ncbi:unnamed protein product [Bursaphelenchus xylophilus]|uniref:(pine wood nematode) hypothetical protein n=1 Tax=Bursaphelenchus xylophilus TaxID=6326 RepID=A0A7I8X6Q0_BURXY|nr:unnamed protein product [Bursaphelenchus xylophilus]CAG9122950.1 unnamed protein product [Bursaphelenchus xylophilus]
MFRDVGSIQRFPGSGRPKTEKAPALKKSIRNRTDPDLSRSLERMASKLIISALSGRIIVKTGMRCPPYSILCGPCVDSTERCKTRLQCFRKLRKEATDTVLLRAPTCPPLSPPISAESRGFSMKLFDAIE